MLTNKTQIPSIGVGTIMIQLHDYLVQLRGVLHVLALHVVPLILVWWFHYCSHKAALLSQIIGVPSLFPHVIVLVDDSADYLVTLSVINQLGHIQQVHFDEA